MNYLLTKFTRHSAITRVYTVYKEFNSRLRQLSVSQLLEQGRVEVGRGPVLYNCAIACSSDPLKRQGRSLSYNLISLKAPTASATKSKRTTFPRVGNSKSHSYPHLRYGSPYFSHQCSLFAPPVAPRAALLSQLPEQPRAPQVSVLSHNHHR